MALLLTLIRHAQTSPAMSGQSDHARQLSDRGCLDALNMATWCREHLPRPDVWLVSSAKRAQKTALLLTAMDDAAELSTEPGLYAASSAIILGLLSTMGNYSQHDCQHIAVVGHNPGISQVVCLLASKQSRATPTDMPPLGLAHFSLAIDNWETINPDCVKLMQFTTPELIPSAPTP